MFTNVRDFFIFTKNMKTLIIAIILFSCVELFAQNEKTPWFHKNIKGGISLDSAYSYMKDKKQ